MQSFYLEFESHFLAVFESVKLAMLVNEKVSDFDGFLMRLRLILLRIARSHERRRKDRCKLGDANVGHSVNNTLEKRTKILEQNESIEFESRHTLANCRRIAGVRRPRFISFVAAKRLWQFGKKGHKQRSYSVRVANFLQFQRPTMVSIVTQNLSNNQFVQFFLYFF